MSTIFQDSVAAKGGCSRRRVSALSQLCFARAWASGVSLLSDRSGCPALSCGTAGLCRLICSWLIGCGDAPLVHRFGVGLSYFYYCSTIGSNSHSLFVVFFPQTAHQATPTTPFSEAWNYSKPDFDSLRNNSAWSTHHFSRCHPCSNFRSHSSHSDIHGAGSGPCHRASPYFFHSPNDFVRWLEIDRYCTHSCTFSSTSISAPGGHCDFAVSVCLGSVVSHAALLFWVNCSD